MFSIASQSPRLAAPALLVSLAIRVVVRISPIILGVAAFIGYGTPTLLARSSGNRHEQVIIRPHSKSLPITGKTCPTENEQQRRRFEMCRLLNWQRST